MENIFLVSFGPIQGFSKFWKLRHNKDVCLGFSVLGQTKAVIFNCSYSSTKKVSLNIQTFWLIFKSFCAIEKFFKKMELFWKFRGLIYEEKF